MNDLTIKLTIKLKPSEGHFKIYISVPIPGFPVLLSTFGFEPPSLSKLQPDNISQSQDAVASNQLSMEDSRIHDTVVMRYFLLHFDRTKIFNRNTKIISKLVLTCFQIQMKKVF